MKIGHWKIWLLSLGLFLCGASHAGQKPEPPARAWTDQWLNALAQQLGLPVEQVLHRAPEGKPAIPRRLNIPFFTAPPITGPLSFVRALNVEAQLPETYDQLEIWVDLKGTPEQKAKFNKIKSDLTRHYQSRGYSPQQAWQLSRNLISEKLYLYRDLVMRSTPNPATIPAQKPPGATDITATDYYNLGLLRQKEDDFQEAAKWYQKAVRSNHVMAQASLGFLYETGQGVTRDLAKAMEYYYLAAKQGHSVAQFNLGRIYQNGLKHGLQQIKPNAQLAENFLMRAANQGIVAAHHQLGVFYYSAGQQIQQKLDRATPAQIAEWHTNKEAIAAWDKNGDNRISPDENQQFQVAQVSFVKAAKQEHGPSQHALGVMYLQGMGVPANPKAAAQWLEKAARHQVPEALYNLALLYERGLGVRPNVTYAFTLYDQAANLGQAQSQQGHPPSQYNLGLFYYQGRDAGTRLSVEVPKEFHDQHPAKKLPGELVQMDPEGNAFLKNAVALYRPNFISGNWTLKLLVPKGQGKNALEVFEEFVRQQKLKTAGETTIEQLGGYNPTQAYVWWKLAADQKQEAAITGLELLRQRVLTPDQVKAADTEAAKLSKKIKARSLQAPSPMVHAQTQAPFKAGDWSTGFFVSEDGYVITGKHLLRSGNQFQVVTENGVFPARAIQLPGDLDQYLLLKVDGDYQFPILPLSASHGTRQRDKVQVLGYQLPHDNQSFLPRAAQADTTIRSVLGAQADPRFFTLQHPVLGDQLLLKFSRYLDDDKQPVANPLSDRDLRAVQGVTREQVQGLLRATHVLLRNTHISVGYHLQKTLWYDEVRQKWLRDPQPRARKHIAGSWVVVDGRKIHKVPLLDAVKEGQPLIRISVIPGMVERDRKNVPDEVRAALNVSADKRTAAHWQAIRNHYLRLYQLAEEALVQDRTSPRKQDGMQETIKQASFEVINKTPGFRGSALLNRQGQAVGMFFPSYRGRSPDVFQNFSSYHRYVLKSDHLKAFLDRLPDVKYTTARPAPPSLAANGETNITKEVYWLAKAKASMVLVQVTGGLKTQAKTVAGGTTP
jgi:TPR repeat protein